MRRQAKNHFFAFLYLGRNRNEFPRLAVIGVELPGANVVP